MSLLFKDKIINLLNGECDNGLTITPLLDKEKQIGECTVNLRLGTSFKVDLKTRQPYYDPYSGDRPVETFFEDTSRNFGERFLLYPGQLVLSSTFEYIRLPDNIFGLIFTRSSWNRLGLRISSVVQPGYVGVLNLELMNNSSNPIALYSGIRIVQLILFTFNGKKHNSYLSRALSKYVANSEPKLSSIQLDHDLEVIKKKFPI